MFYFYLKRSYLSQIIIKTKSSINFNFYKINFKNFILVLLNLSFILTYIGIFYAFYIYWCRDFILSDIQGRYFIPLIILLPIIINLNFNLLVDRKNNKQKLKTSKNNDFDFFLNQALIKQIITLAFINQIVYLANIVGYYALRFNV